MASKNQKRKRNRADTTARSPFNHAPLSGSQLCGACQGVLIQTDKNNAGAFDPYCPRCKENDPRFIAGRKFLASH